MTDLAKPDRYLHYQYYNQSGDRVLANFLMGLQHAAGIMADDYGDRDLCLSHIVDPRTVS